MTLSRNAIAGLAFAACAMPVLAEEVSLQSSSLKAESVVGSKESRFQNFYLEKKISEDHKITRGRAYVDRILGVTCEWQEKGRLGSNQYRVAIVVDMEGEAMSCVQTVDIPKQWAAIEGNTLITRESSGQNPKNPLEFWESYESVDVNGNTQFRATHKWNMATQKACLQTSEIIWDEREEGRPFVKDWGCFDITDEGKRRLNEIMEKIGLVPA